jgi:Sulfotransferase family
LQTRRGALRESDWLEMNSEASLPLLVFVHLRKTAGTTAASVMRRQFGKGEVMNLNAPTIEAANRIWLSIPSQQRARVRCIRGHLPCAANLFPPRSTRFFTILRDPVERVISEYYFNLRNAGERFHRILTRERMTLGQFVKSSLSAEVHNAQTRLLSGAGPGPCAKEQLVLAVRSLRDQMAVVGITNRLDETLLLCRVVFGWRYPIYREVNVNRRRPSIDAIAPSTLAEIEEANSLDRRLYQFACHRLEQLVREYRISTSQIARLQRASRIYGSIRRCIGFPREVWTEMQTASARRRVARSPA